MLIEIGREIRRAWRKLFGGSERPQEPSQPPDVTTPAPEPPATPEPPQQSTRADVLDVNRISIWCEASGAYDRGIRDGIAWALHGRAGAQNIRIAHPWYDPWTRPINRAEWVRRLQAAKAEGCVAFGIDTEGWLFAQGAIVDAWEAAKQVGIKILHVPKASIGLGPKPPHVWIDTDFDGSVRFLEAHSDGVWLWNYGFDGEGYRAITEQWRAAGYTGQIGWIQDQVRNHGGYMGRLQWRSVVNTARQDRISFMLFAGNHSSPAEIDELRRMYQ